MSVGGDVRGVRGGGMRMRRWQLQLVFLALLVAPSPSLAGWAEELGVRPGKWRTGSYVDPITDRTTHMAHLLGEDGRSLLTLRCDEGGTVPPAVAEHGYPLSVVAEITSLPSVELGKPTVVVRVNKQTPFRIPEPMAQPGGLTSEAGHPVVHVTLDFRDFGWLERRGSLAIRVLSNWPIDAVFRLPAPTPATRRLLKCIRNANSQLLRRAQSAIDRFESSGAGQLPGWLFSYRNLRRHLAEIQKGDVDRPEDSLSLCGSVCEYRMLAIAASQVESALMQFEENRVGYVAVVSYRTRLERWIRETFPELLALHGIPGKRVLVIELDDGGKPFVSAVSSVSGWKGQEEFRRMSDWSSEAAKVWNSRIGHSEPPVFDGPVPLWRGDIRVFFEAPTKDSAE